MCRRIAHQVPVDASDGNIHYEKIVHVSLEGGTTAVIHSVSLVSIENKLKRALSGGMLSRAGYRTVPLKVRDAESNRVSFVRSCIFGFVQRGRKRVRA